MNVGVCRVQIACYPQGLGKLLKVWSRVTLKPNQLGRRISNLVHKICFSRANNNTYVCMYLTYCSNGAASDSLREKGV